MSSPSATPAAVFLSYAREDSEAARRIADALRGFGVEVWFAGGARGFEFGVLGLELKTNERMRA